MEKRENVQIIPQPISALAGEVTLSHFMDDSWERFASAKSLEEACDYSQFSDFFCCAILSEILPVVKNGL